VYRVTRRAADADDIVQDAFCRLLRADVDNLDEGDLRRYVFRIASNLLADRWRRSERERSWLARLRGEPPAAPTGTGDEVGLARELAELTPRDRALLWLAYVEEHNHQEIASALGEHDSTVMRALPIVESMGVRLSEDDKGRMSVAE